MSPRAPLLRPRSVAEEHLYMDLHPCGCGEADWRSLEHALRDDAGDLCSTFSGRCARCGAPRSFVFLVPHSLELPEDAFGGAAPSTVLDAGQYLGASDGFAAVPASASAVPIAERPAGAAGLRRAIACLDEVLKFLPEDASALPPERLFSAAGKEIYLQAPGRFTRLRLEARRTSYQRLLGDYLNPAEPGQT